jgi:ubiquinone/menaquinone biosynthesis C-methylase UbiE
MSSNKNTPPLEITKNGFGFMHHKSIILDAFIAFAQTCSKPVLDVGAAYGVAVIPCLQVGSKVIALDICQEHLDILETRVAAEYSNNLTCVLARFPDQIDFEEKSLSAVFISHVLTFIDPEEVLIGIRKVYEWLEEGGKLFILNYTPYHKTLASFIPVYEENVKAEVMWPAFVQDKKHFSTVVSEHVPNKLNLMDISTLKKIATKSGFHVELLKYIGGIEQGVPHRYCLDGREWVGLIARK